jgi:translation initiation factor 1 (eIF-1/SUI1)
MRLTSKKLIFYHVERTYLDTGITDTQTKMDSFLDEHTSTSTSTNTSTSTGTKTTNPNIVSTSGAGTMDKSKIIIKHRKIKKATRTYLYNINQWITEDQIKDISQQLKKKLATSGQIIEDEEGYALTFNGDHMQIIKDAVIGASRGCLTQKCFV